ncbi:hypothetical protein [Clostridium beijerinckii]|jgi:hypothetical protein|uniref:Uncharacterized protein n=1 Tax=Clostridium beijerinckii TaxID=1520 RepID=A0A1S9NAB7_CLOBE|nr:hypothetical protein [Clostridium beijerinckii]OOP74341.1 hypothetical protein CBEIBR21_07580 [Clostridium beijerinckii]
MAKKKKAPPKNDFAFEENNDICSFSNTLPSDGICISSFSFEDNCNNDTSVINTTINKTENSNESTISTESTSSNNPLSFNSRITPVSYGAVPPIDGETANIKRSYTLRSSTIRKINELKSIHPEINVCISSIVDIAIDHYHNHIINEGGIQ